MKTKIFKIISFLFFITIISIGCKSTDLTSTSDSEYARTVLPSEFETDNPTNLRSSDAASTNIVSNLLNFDFIGSPAGNTAIGYNALNDLVKKVRGEMYWTNQIVELARKLTETQYKGAVGGTITLHQDASVSPVVPFNVDSWSFDYSITWNTNYSTTEDLVKFAFKRQITSTLKPDATLSVTFNKSDRQQGRLKMFEGPFTNGTFSSYYNIITLDFYLLPNGQKSNKYSRSYKTLDSSSNRTETHYQNINLIQESTYSSKGTKVIMIGNKLKQTPPAFRELESDSIIGYADQNGGGVIFEKKFDFNDATSNLYLKHQFKETFSNVGGFNGQFQYQPFLEKWVEVANPTNIMPASPSYDPHISINEFYNLPDSLHLEFIKDLYKFNSPVSKLKLTINKPTAPILPNIRGRFSIFLFQGLDASINCLAIPNSTDALNGQLKNITDSPYSNSIDGFLDGTAPVQTITMFLESLEPTSTAIIGYWDNNFDSWNPMGFDPAKTERKYCWKFPTSSIPLPVFNVTILDASWL